MKSDVFRLTVTGHRQIVPVNHTGDPWPYTNPTVYNHHAAVYKELCEILADVVKSNRAKEYHFITGMALGADQLFGWAAVWVRDNHPEIPIKVVAAVPFQGQEGKWTPKAKEVFSNLLNKCDHVQYVCDPGYAPWKMQKRNEWMVDRADAVLALWDGTEKGGTYNCMKYAHGKGIGINILNPSSLEYNAVGW